MFLPLIVLQCGVWQIKKFLVVVMVLAEKVLCFCGARKRTKNEFLCNLAVTGAQAGSTVPAATNGAPTV
jgi:hypothetical protein